ncbi:hypothetical protein EYF80_010255 [Liparis tanakae]|uniref:Uncharacterized protein n=1 Tax=Liparis tanakae TaxID=230148 RepID=A0A4Z2INQ5_9TELE|nr:hypothetical protein EYF80_010255 [Liparis tanakae]
MPFSSSRSHFSTWPRALDVEMTSSSCTTSPSLLFMWVMSSSSVNTTLAMPSKHFFRWGCTLEESKGENRFVNSREAVSLLGHLNQDVRGAEYGLQVEPSGLHLQPLIQDLLEEQQFVLPFPTGEDEYMRLNSMSPHSLDIFSMAFSSEYSLLAASLMLSKLLRCCSSCMDRY